MPRIFGQALLIVILFAHAASAQPDSCLKLLDKYLVDSTWVNPDSVRVDTCEHSLTRGQMFAKSWFQVEFSYYAIPTPVGPADTIIQRYWTDISPEYQSTRDSFSSLQSRLGSFYFQKLQPDVTDTSQGRSSIFAIKFDGYQNIELTVAELARIPGIDYVSYVNRAAQVAGVDDMREAVRVQQCVLIRLNDPASVQRAIRILELGFNERAQLVDICGRVVRETNENFDSGMLQSLDRGLYFLLSSRGKSAKIKVE